jgi:hypothetical protein
LGRKSFPGVVDISIGKSPDHWTQCFYLHRLDGTTTDIGFRKSLKPLNNKQKIAKACRTAVQPSIDKFKKTIKYGVDCCSITGIVLYEFNSHIDHYQPQFNEIVLDWFNSLQLTDNDIDVIADQFVNKSMDNNSITYFTNYDMANDFKNYHDSVAVLRCIDKHENMKRTKHNLLR